jgi:hypothetical protein
MTKYVQSRDELLGHLRDQITFMKQSANSYDKGFEDEAKRLAVIIRVLVHDTRNSTSLLTLLNKKAIRFYDSAIPYDPQNLLPYNALTMMGLSPDKSGFYAAPLDGGADTRSKTRRIPFKIWWQGMFVIRDKNNKAFTRKDLVLNTANTDGGAHIDPNLDEDYASLSRFNSLGWKVFRRDIEDDFSNSPVLPSIRQIAHEVLKTLKDEFPELF